MAVDVKWLENLPSLAVTHGFSRSAVARSVTQSTFSRRIRALEEWLGADLVNRDSHPQPLTDEGKLFGEPAEEPLRMRTPHRDEFRHRAHSGGPQITVTALRDLIIASSCPPLVDAGATDYWPDRQPRDARQLRLLHRGSGRSRL